MAAGVFDQFSEEQLHLIIQSQFSYKEHEVTVPQDARIGQLKELILGQFSAETLLDWEITRNPTLLFNRKSIDAYDPSIKITDLGITHGTIVPLCLHGSDRLRITDGKGRWVVGPRGG